MAKKPLTEDEKLAKVAKFYKKYGNATKVQDHFPDVSVRTIQRWVLKARAKGLL
jgi:transposase